jgi:glycosyltransferase involved in cell wall biosynthesis
MHICIFSTRSISPYLPNWGGVHTHTKNLVSLLLSQGYDVSLLSSAEEKITTESFNLIPIAAARTGEQDRLCFRKANKAFLELHSEKPIDCVFSEGSAVRGLMQLINQLQIPIVSFVHLLNYHYFYNIWQEVDGLHSLKSYIFGSIPRFLYGIIKIDIPFLRKCNKVVTGSKTIAEQINHFYRIPSKKITVIHNWVDTNVFRKDLKARHTLRKTMGISHNQLVFLLVGFLWRPKGFRIAISSFEDLITRIPNALLLISGEGPDRSYIETYINRSKKLTERVRLLGLCPHEKLPSLYSSADVFIIPSLMNEVLPYTLLEAMSCQLPIIATDIPANREALGDEGHFVPRNNVKSLTETMFDIVSKLQMKRDEAEISRERVINLFSSERAIKRMDALINDLTLTK